MLESPPAHLQSIREKGCRKQEAAAQGLHLRNSLLGACKMTLLRVTEAFGRRLCTNGSTCFSSTHADIRSAQIAHLHGSMCRWGAELERMAQDHHVLHCSMAEPADEAFVHAMTPGKTTADRMAVHGLEKMRVTWWLCDLHASARLSPDVPKMRVREGPGAARYASASIASAAAIAKYSDAATALFWSSPPSLPFTVCHAKIPKIALLNGSGHEGRRHQSSRHTNECPATQGSADFLIGQFNPAALVVQI